MAVGMGEPKEKVRARMIEAMIQPVGKPPEVNKEYPVNASVVTLIDKKGTGLEKGAIYFQPRNLSRNHIPGEP